MFTATANLMLPSTVTGSWPRPRWFDVSMWGTALDTCMMDVRFREKFQDALAVVISDQERAGLDLLTHGDYHCDEDMAGRAWHHGVFGSQLRFVQVAQVSCAQCKIGSRFLRRRLDCVFQHGDCLGCLSAAKVVIGHLDS